MVGTILMIFALVLLVIAAAGKPEWPFQARVGWAGMAFWAAAVIFGGVRISGLN